MEAVLDRLIVSEPGYRGGRPRIAGTRITVADVAIWRLRWGMTPVEIAARSGDARFGFSGLRQPVDRSCRNSLLPNADAVGG